MTKELDALDGAHAVVLDLDCWSPRMALPPTVLDRLVAVSNDSAHTPEEMAACLALKGLRLPPERIVLAGSAAAALVAARRVLPLTSASIRRLLRRLGARLDADSAEVVLVGRDPDLSLDRLHDAARALAAGAEMMTCSAQPMRAGPDGAPLPDAGAIAVALGACVPWARRRLIGLPEPDLLRIALDRLGGVPEHSILLGGGPAAEAARALGLRVFASQLAAAAA